MQKVVTTEEMREIDRLTTEKYGIPSIILMENAAHAAARVILEKFNHDIKDERFFVLCGKGNNGGDGMALARILWTMGASVFVELFGEVKDTKSDARTNFEFIEYVSVSNETNGPNENCLWLKENANFGDINIPSSLGINRDDTIIDALFGTGLNKNLDGDLKLLATKFNNWKLWQKFRTIISLDIPSGLNADLAEPIGENFHSDLTITFTAPKLANVFPPASNFNGELHVVNIGSPQELIDNSLSKLFVAEKSDASYWLSNTEPRNNSYKKTRGTALIIAGSENYSGAAVLAANACFASGCGMVSVAVPIEILPIVASKTSDEIIVKTIDKIEFDVDVIGIGCGLSNDKLTHKFIRETIKNRKTPMVLDAEALNALSPFNLQGSDEFPLILTPHIGEFKRLLGREVGEDKIAQVREFAVKHNVILVLKGERSLIAKPDGTVVINPTGNAGISRAGAGDTLTGIITSFLAQTFAVRETNIENAFNAVVSALYIAGLAGEIAAEKFSERLMTATDVRNCLQSAIVQINNEK
jgi:ADP-dependent NAD(P)H-hydrate dehydratase / NAD(P)H-hydrate epimerase